MEVYMGDDSLEHLES